MTSEERAEWIARVRAADERDQTVRRVEACLRRRYRPVTEFVEAIVEAVHAIDQLAEEWDTRRHGPMPVDPELLAETRDILDRMIALFAPILRNY